MPKEKRLLTLDELYYQLETLTTAHQMALKNFLQKTLDEKKNRAEEEFRLIEAGGKKE